MCDFWDHCGDKIDDLNDFLKDILVFSILGMGSRMYGVWLFLLLVFVKMLYFNVYFAGLSLL